jgi:hypothetical protein
MPLLPEKIVKYVIKKMGAVLFEDVIKKLMNFEKTVWSK